jgi:hypothetical protein
MTLALPQPSIMLLLLLLLFLLLLLLLLSLTPPLPPAVDDATMTRCKLQVSYFPSNYSNPKPLMHYIQGCSAQQAVFKGADLSDAALDETFLEQAHKDLVGVRSLARCVDTP